MRSCYLKTNVIARFFYIVYYKCLLRSLSKPVLKRIVFWVGKGQNIGRFLLWSCFFAELLGFPYLFMRKIESPCIRKHMRAGVWLLLAI